MATNLYEILGISRNATEGEIRRAYRRKALETHPDRLPQGASAAEKSASEDLFRKVNNAYEVLNDPQSRAAYDQHGVWPPPEPAPRAAANGPTPFPDPFFRNPFFSDAFSRAPRMDPFGAFGFGPQPGQRGTFTDPFVLFNSIFGDLHRAFESDPFFNGGTFEHRGAGANHNHFDGGFFNGTFPMPSMSPSPFGFGGGGAGSSRMQTFGNGGNGGRWISQSWSSSTVNGVTHTKSVRRDLEGNEHITYQYPDGTERYTINGVEQSTSLPPRALPLPAPPAPLISRPTQADDIPPPYHEAVARPPHRSHSSRHHRHHDHAGDRREVRDRSREYEAERGGHGYRNDRYGRDGQDNSPWKFWRS